MTLSKYVEITTMNYLQFKDWAKKVVLYQAQNRKHKDWEYSRKVEFNFTTRQIQAHTGVPRSTVCRWIKRLVNEGVLVLQRKKRATKQNYFHMKFYRHQGVDRILRAIQKVKCYKFLRKKKVEKEKKDLERDGTLKHNYSNYKNIKQRMVMSESGNLRHDDGWIPVSEIDNRTTTGVRKEKIVSAERCSEFFGEMLTKVFATLGH